MTTDRLLKLGEVAELLSCSPRHVARLVKDGRLPVIRFGSRMTRVHVATPEELAGLKQARSLPTRAFKGSMAARYRGTCTRCGDRFEKGDLIYWRKVAGDTFTDHEMCHRAKGSRA